MANGNRRQKERLINNHDLYKDQILSEQVKQIYGLAPIGFVATLINSIIVFLIMKEVMRYSLLIPWLSAVLTVTAMRFGLVIWFRSAAPEPAAVAKWGTRFIAGLFIAGFAWGSIGFFPFSELSPAHQVFIAFVLGGMAAGASSSFSMLKPAYVAFSIPALLPLTIHFFLLPDVFHCSMGIMIFLFGFLLWRISLHNYSINCISLRLRFENTEIIENLKKANERVQTLNSRLLTEIEAKQQAEAALRAQHEFLEKTVEERTSELVNANEQLTKAKQTSEAANKAKSEFLINMSHEMRTPLAGTLGMINLVLEMEIGDEEQRLLQMAKRSGDSLLRIISDVLDFSRLEAGVMRFEKELFDLSEIVMTSVEVVSLTAAEKEIELTWQIEESVPKTLTGDKGRLRQVLVNLLGNSVKFTEGGQIEVIVRSSGNADTGDQFLLFHVRDTGMGIPPFELENIFDKFTQIDSSLTRRHGGTGLGLALTRQIVEKWGGSIWAESSVGVGSTFYFTFPVG